MKNVNSTYEKLRKKRKIGKSYFLITKSIKDICPKEKNITKNDP